MRVLTGILTMIVLLATSATSVSAMQLMMFVEEQSTDGKKTGSHTIYADKDNGINVEFQDSRDHGSIIWNKIKNIAWVVDFTEGTYWSMTEEDAAKVKKMRQEMMPRMKAQQEKMKALFDEQMKGMSEEEKKAAMQHLPLGMEMGEEAETVYEKAGSEAVGQWGKADIYVGRQSGNLVEKVWTVKFDQLGVDESYLKVFGDFGEFAGGFMDDEEGDGPFKLAQIEEEQGFPGFAVKRERYGRRGEKESIEITKTVETQETDLSNYQLPTEPPLEETEGPFDDMPTDMPGMPNMPPGF